MSRYWFHLALFGIGLQIVGRSATKQAYAKGFVDQAMLVAASEPPRILQSAEALRHGAARIDILALPQQTPRSTFLTSPLQEQT